MPCFNYNQRPFRSSSSIPKLGCCAVKNWTFNHLFRFLFFVLLFPPLANTQATQILADNHPLAFQYQDFSLLPQRGKLQLTCLSEDGVVRSVEASFCRRNLVLPEKKDFYFGPIGLEADELLIEIYSPSGKLKWLRVSYDGRKARSQRPLNFWSESLSEDPLLEVGENKLSFRLYLRGRNVFNEEQVLNLRTRPIVRCEDKQYRAVFKGDCPVASSFCDYYFQQNPC